MLRDWRAAFEGVVVDCGRRSGDSGRGREGRDLARNVAGDWARCELRTETDCENLFGALDGGVISSRSSRGIWSTDGVVGVSGMEPEEVGDWILMARAMGRNMPAPGTEVVK